MTGQLLISETLLCNRLGRVLLCKKFDDGEKISPSLCFLAAIISARLGEQAEPSGSHEFFLLTAGVMTGRLLLGLVVPSPGLGLEIVFFSL